jgi:hypothetical protein
MGSTSPPSNWKHLRLRYEMVEPTRMSFKERVMFWNAQAQLLGRPPVWWKRLAIRWVLGVTTYG